MNRETQAKYHISEKIAGLNRLNKLYAKLRKGKPNSVAFLQDVQKFRTKLDELEPKTK